MQLNDFFTRLKTQPESIQFQDTIAVIEANYQFTPTAFRNGEAQNDAGQNSGSCKIFFFADLHHLTAAETLQCFGDYYRIDVLQHPDANDHQNIRHFMRFGWDGIVFSGQALAPRTTE